MASVPHDHQNSVSASNDCSVWEQVFDAETRKRLLSDDLFAGKSVSAVLTSIVALGVVLSFLTLFIIML